MEQFTIPAHLGPFRDNVMEVERLSEIHERVAGTSAGRKSGVEVLNKSAIVLLVACWESYVEELAEISFNLMLDRAETHDIFPRKVLTLASKDLKEHDDQTKVWQLADDGWRGVLKKHKAKILKRYTGLFITPNATNIDELFHCLVGTRNVSNDWYWPGVSAVMASKKLDRLIKLRGQIAHKVVTDKGVRKSLVNNYTHFIQRLAGILSNTVGAHIYRRTGHKPWDAVEYIGHKNVR